MIGRIYTVFFRTLLGIVGTVIAVSYITWAAWTENFPAPQVRFIIGAFEQVTQSLNPWYLGIETTAPPVNTVAPTELATGLIMVVGVDGERHNFIRVIDRSGAVIQEWQPDWFQIWPDASFVPADKRPVSQPGAIVHGASVTADGGIVFNFEYLSTMKLDACGDPAWKLPNFGHHSLYQTRSQEFWVTAAEFSTDAHHEIPYIGPPYQDDLIQHISADGKILQSVSLYDVARNSGHTSLLYLSSLKDDPTAKGDLLHLNDIDIYEGPAGGAVVPGDIMVSLRHLNAVWIIDPDKMTIRHMIMGDFLRQHDPDFLDGSRIVLLNNIDLRTAQSDDTRRSHLIEYDIRNNQQTDYVNLSKPAEFFTYIMGKHQILENGNSLITSSAQARVMEVSASGKLLWEYHNKVSETGGGLVSEGSLLPPEMDADFFARARAACEG